MESDLKKIIKQLFYFRRARIVRPVNSLTRKNRQIKYQAHKAAARDLIEQKVKRYQQLLQVNYQRLSIRDQKTRWGSCSKKGNLNFNYKILFLPERLADYIIAHELCHLKEFNHSKQFWDLVGKVIPDYIRYRKELRQIKMLR